MTGKLLILGMMLMILGTAAFAETGQTGFTVPVPAGYMHESRQRGRVEALTYDSRDYVREGAGIQKTAYIYLPYGYDENDTDTRYNILYLMHGWGGHAGEYFESTPIRNLLDHLIENGQVPPIIVVSPSFYNANSNRDFGSSIDEFRQFHLDFENYLMPAVEGKYHTYAEGTTLQDFEASRDHRAFGGFSLGSVTTWLEFCHDADYIRYFLPMSGSSWYYGTYGDFQIERNVDHIAKVVQEKGLNERGYFIYHAVGTMDSVKSQSLMMADEMLRRADAFPAEHYVFCQKEGGYHDLDAVQEYLYNALPLFFREGEQEVSRSVSHFTAESTVSDVANDPAFEDFGRLLFPVDRNVPGGMTLQELTDSGVYVWYNNIHTDKTLEIVDVLHDAAAAGERIFFQIYSEEEMEADPSKRDTGLFLFRGMPGEKFAICNAGGGFMYVGAMHDSFPHALELSKMGYNTFALIYRPENAYEDLGRAIAFINDHAEELQVSPVGYSLWGGSAGARMAAALGNAAGLAYYTSRDDIPQAAAVVMQYTGYTTVSPADAPTYANCGTRDGIASYRTMESRLNALSAYGISTEFHAYDGLPHGYGLGTDTVAEGWIRDAVAFWEAQTP